MNILNHTKAELVDHMGSDLTVVNAARVSFESESWWEDALAQQLTHGDQGLINFLAKNNHWSPFAHPQLQFRYTVPIFLARQEFKHIVGFVRNEVSGRYVNKSNGTLQFYLPDEFHRQPVNKKQGSSDEVMTKFFRTTEEYNEEKDEYEIVSRESSISAYGRDLYEQCEHFYTDLVNSGVAVEEARMFLPQGMITSYYVTGSLYGFARFFNQRTDSHAQKAIQDHARLVGPAIEELFPYSWGVLTGGGLPVRLPSEGA